MPRRLALVAVASAAALCVSAAPASAATVVNGDFETGTLAGWTVSDSGSGSWFAYSGTTSPLSGSTISAPPQGVFAATTDQGGPGSHVLYQDIALAPASKHTLTLFAYWNNAAGVFSTPSSLDESVIPNQQYRIDVMKAGADPRSVAPADVLANVVQTNPGDPATQAPTVYTADLSPFAGQTIRLRAAEVDNQLFFQAGLDDVKIVSTQLRGTTVVCSSSTVRVGHPVTCKATVTGGVHPTGTITWASNSSGTFSSTTCTLVQIGGNQAACTVTYTPTLLGTGSHKIYANYSGDAANAPSHNSTTITVTP